MIELRGDFVGYTEKEIISKCEEAFAKINTFYQAEVVNYRGYTADTNEPYTEVVARYLCERVNAFALGIPQITRKSSYKTQSHLGEYSETSNRKEEVTAIKMYLQSQKSGVYDYIGRIIDYQTPLKSKRGDVAGKIDLLSYDGNTLRLLELKKSDSTETMLRCVLEGFTYLCTVNQKKLLEDFELPNDTKIEANPFVYKGGIQYGEMQEQRPWLFKLMTSLNSKPFYIVEENGIYRVED